MHTADPDRCSAEFSWYSVHPDERIGSAAKMEKSLHVIQAEIAFGLYAYAVQLCCSKQNIAQPAAPCASACVLVAMTFSVSNAPATRVSGFALKFASAPAAQTTSEVSSAGRVVVVVVSTSGFA